MSNPGHDPSEGAAGSASGDVSDALPSLPVYDVGAGAAGRIRRGALAALERDAWRAAHPAASRLALWYRHALEPAVLIGLALSYVAWSVAGTLAMLH